MYAFHIISKEIDIILYSENSYYLFDRFIKDLSSKFSSKSLKIFQSIYKLSPSVISIKPDAPAKYLKDLEDLLKHLRKKEKREKVLSKIFDENKKCLNAEKLISDYDKFKFVLKIYNSTNKETIKSIEKQGYKFDNLLIAYANYFFNNNQPIIKRRGRSMRNTLCYSARGCSCFFKNLS